MFECLNKCSGLFSLFAALASVIVPLWIYCKQKKERQQDLTDELDILTRPHDPLAMDKGLRDRDEKMALLKKKLGRK